MRNTRRGVEAAPGVAAPGDAPAAVVIRTRRYRYIYNYLSIYLSIYPCRHIYLSIYLSIHLPIYPFIYLSTGVEAAPGLAAAPPGDAPARERGFFIDSLLVQIPCIIEMILVDRPCAMGV